MLSSPLRLRAEGQSEGAGRGLRSRIAATDVTAGERIYIREKGKFELQGEMQYVKP